MLSLTAATALTASQFEQSQAYQDASPVMRKTYEILSNLDPVEIVLSGSNPAHYNNFYAMMIESSFHNVVTPTLAVFINQNVKEHLDHLEETLEHNAKYTHEDEKYEMPDFPSYNFRNIIMKRDEAITNLLVRAHEEALKEVLKQGKTAEMGVLDSNGSRLLVLRHYDN